MKTKTRIFIITMTALLAIPLALVFGADVIHKDKITALMYLYLYEVTAFLIIVFLLVIADWTKDNFRK